MLIANLRLGFTLVVIAISRVMVGLLLPAVQAAREAARWMMREMRILRREEIDSLCILEQLRPARSKVKTT